MIPNTFTIKSGVANFDLIQGVRIAGVIFDPDKKEIIYLLYTSAN